MMGTAYSSNIYSALALFLFISGRSAGFHRFTITHDVEQRASLETIADEIKEHHEANFQIDIYVHELELNGNISFTKLKSLIINGHPNSTIIKCSTGNNTGILISDIADTLTISHLNLEFCGLQIESSLLQEDKFYLSGVSALTIDQCNDVRLSHLVIARSKGTGLTIINHRGGRVLITSSMFIDNKLPHYNEQTIGGGGVYLSITLPTIILFNHCTFENNTSHTKEFRLYTSSLGQLEVGYGQGGGLYLSLRSGQNNILLSISNCKFIGNQAFHGGGLLVSISGNSLENNTVNITNSIFEYNGCNNTNGKHTWFGGGAHLSFNSDFDGSGITKCHYLIRNVTLKKNCAEHGGGVYYFSDRQNSIESVNSNTMIFDNCTFSMNQAFLGSAIIMTPNIFLKKTSGHTIVPMFKDCSFLDNRVHINYTRIQKPTSVGVIYASLYDICFEGYNQFKNNKGSGIYMVNGIVNLTNSNISFINNTGIHGGAITLLGASTILVGPNNYEFVNNTAIFQGGALYVSMFDSADFTTSWNCFLQYCDSDGSMLSRKWNANITFIGNRAKDCTAGHAIYATSLHSCQVINNASGTTDHYIRVNTSEIFTTQGVTFDQNKSLYPQIATDGALLHTKATYFNVIPGERHPHGVTITNDLGQIVKASFRVAISRRTRSVKFSPDYSTVVGEGLRLRGEPNESAILYLQPISPRLSYVRLDVELVDCPPGFKLGDQSECICNVHEYIGLFECNLDSFHSFLLRGYWVGLIDTPYGTELATSACMFCDYAQNLLNSSEFKVQLPQSHSDLNSAVCGTTRVGILCGKCQDHYTVHFHSPGYLCKPVKPVGCSLGWLFYILSELMPVTMVFIVVLVFNISFTSGAINGFILFSQLLDSIDIDASGIARFQEWGISGSTQGYQVLYGLFNLDFFNSESLSFCLWKGASALDMIAFKYVTILYTFLLIVMIIWIINRCGGRLHCRISSIKTSIIHGISTFLVICYAQCIKVSLSLLIPAYLDVEDNSTHKPSTRVWLNGELVYFGNKHLLYALPALFCLVTVGLLPPALLLTYPAVNKILTVIGCEDLKLVIALSRYLPISNLKPLLDSFQGCFKDNFRFFAGLYFLYRWTILLTYKITKGYSTYYTAVGVILVVMLTIHTVSQPYIKRRHNIMDTLIFANLILINSFSFLNFHISHRGKDADASSAIVQVVLIYIPLVVMCLYLLVTFYRIIKHWCPEKTSNLRELLTIRKEEPELSTIQERYSDEDTDPIATYEYYLKDRVVLDSKHD